MLAHALGAAVLLGAGAPGTAQSADTHSSAWQFEFTPYLWATGMKGDVQVGRLPTTSLDISFTEILDVLDFGAMGAFEARKGRWGLLFDAIYMKVSDSATASRTGPVGARLTAHADATVKQTLMAAAVAYRASEGRSPIDVIGGLRYAKIDASASIEGSLFGLSGFVSRSGDKDWVDPYVGLRIQHPIADRWTFVGYADLGGFGVGSDLSWQVAAGVNYDFSKVVSFKLGYRHLDVDYDRAGALYDMKISGVYLGVGIRF